MINPAALRHVLRHNAAIAMAHAIARKDADGIRLVQEAIARIEAESERAPEGAR